MCILHHQGRFLHNQRETHSHLSSRPPTPSSQTKRQAKRPHVPSSQPKMPSNTEGTQRETRGQREYKKPSSPRPKRLLFSFSLQASDKKVPPAAPAAAEAAATAPQPPPHHHQPHRSLPVSPCRRHHHQLPAPCRPLAPCSAHHHHQHHISRRATTTSTTMVGTVRSLSAPFWVP